MKQQFKISKTVTLNQQRLVLRQLQFTEMVQKHLNHFQLHQMKATLMKVILKLIPPYLAGILGKFLFHGCVIITQHSVAHFFRSHILNNFQGLDSLGQTAPSFDPASQAAEPAQELLHPRCTSLVHPIAGLRLFTAR